MLDRAEDVAEQCRGAGSSKSIGTADFKHFLPASRVKRLSPAVRHSIQVGLISTLSVPAHSEFFRPLLSPH